MSTFVTAAPNFEAFLENAKDDAALEPRAGGDPRNVRFIPRNFLIEERIDPDRAARYATALPPEGPASFKDWTGAHTIP